MKTIKQDMKYVPLPVATLKGDETLVALPVPIRLGDPAWEREVGPDVVEAIRQRFNQE